MDRDLCGSLLALIFFAAGLGFWTYWWWARERLHSTLALWYSIFFAVAGLVVVVIWRLTAD